MMSAGAYTPARPGVAVPPEGFRAVDAHPGDSHTDATCSSWTATARRSDVESDSGSNASDRGVPKALSVFLELREELEEGQGSRRSWCLFALRNPRAFLCTPHGRQLCLRGLGLLLLAAVAAAISELRAHEHITASLAYRGVGTCLGISPALLRIPGSSSGSPPPRRKQIALAVLIVVVAIALSLEPLRHQDIWEEKDETLVSYLVNVSSMVLLTPLTVTVVCMRHPPSPYFRDAIWCTVAFWLINVLIQMGIIARFFAWESDEAAGIHRQQGPQIGYLFWTASFNFEGVVFTWVARLMATRIKVLEALGGGASCVTRYSVPVLLIMSASFHCKMGCEMLLEVTDWRWKEIYAGVTLIFLSIWALYSSILGALLVHGVKMMRQEAKNTSAAPQAEAKWAAKVLSIEFAACLLLSSTTMCNWIMKLVYVIGKEDVPRGYQPPFIAKIAKSVSVAHKMDYIVNAFSIAVLSGLIWQPAMPKVDDLRTVSSQSMRTQSTGSTATLSPTSTRAGPGLEGVWRAKVKELAHRGIRLVDLLTFWEMLLAKQVMPRFDPARSTTNDVVRQVIIPMSRDPDPRRGGCALASVWNRACNDAPVANNMVTHNWSNLFWHLVAAIVSDKLDQTTYAAVAEDLLDPLGVKRLRRDLASRGVLDVTYWVCAFAINQHSGICGGFGPEPNEIDPQRQAEKMREYESKRRDTVTGEEFRLCDCWQPKIFNDQPAACEMNKFDHMMSLLAQIHVDQKLHPPFSHLIVVDAGFDVFRRAWCVAEIVESDMSQIPQRMKIHSQESLDAHYNSLLRLDVRDCEASRTEDKDMILARIGEDNYEAFNARLAWAVFGTDGLINQWYDGQQRAALVGRILQRAKSASEAEGGRAQHDAGQDGFSRLHGRPRSKTSTSQSSQSSRSLSFRWMDSLRLSMSFRAQPTAERLGRAESESSSDESSDDEARENA